MTAAPRIVCLIGVDGVGKTTQATALAEHLARTGQKTAVVWLRFSHVRSLPLLALARLLRISSMRRVGEHKIGRHAWWRAPRLGRAYAWMLAKDLRAASRRRLAPLLAQGQTVICDRFAHDAVVDLAVSFRDPGFVVSPAADRLLATPPAKRFVVLLDPGPRDAAVRRRPDLALDPDRAERIAAYRALAERLTLPVVDASAPMEKVQARLRRLVMQERSVR